jgi:hypothetical protein
MNLFRTKHWKMAKIHPKQELQNLQTLKRGAVTIVVCVVVEQTYALYVMITLLMEYPNLKENHLKSATIVEIHPIPYFPF